MCIEWHNRFGQQMHLSSTTWNAANVPHYPRFSGSFAMSCPICAQIQREGITRGQCPCPKASHIFKGRTLSFTFLPLPDCTHTHIHPLFHSLWQPTVSKKSMWNEPPTASCPSPFDHYYSTGNTVALTPQHHSPLSNPQSMTLYLLFYSCTSANRSGSNAK